MKIILLNISLLALFFICNAVHGQNSMEDVVYLKNGSILRGTIIEQVPNQSIKIQTKDRNIFVFKFDEIEKITKEKLPIDNSGKTSKAADFKKSGYINLTEISFCPGIGTINVDNFLLRNEDYSFGFKTINGYQINEHLSLGIGIGIDKYLNATLLPITLDTRVTILKGRISPTFNAIAGYSIGKSERECGLVVNPSFGIKIYITKNVGSYFNFGYKWQSKKIDRYLSDENGNPIISGLETSTDGFITLSSGFTF